MKKHIPNMLTGGNLLLGVLSILFSIQGQYHYSISCILIATIFDTFDGRLARKFNVYGDFGKEFDSLADLVTFGVAPSIMSYMLVFQNMGVIGLLMTCLLPLSGAWRLAKFNSQMYKNLNYFTGIPITLNAIIFCFYFMLFKATVIPLSILTIVMSYLMNSKLKIPSFKK